MSAFRRNAFLIDFSNLPKLPKQEEAHLFVHQKLNLGYDDVDSIQLSNAKFALIVECATMELAINTVNKYDRKQFIEVEKKKYQIALSMDDGGTDVKIHDLPPRMDNKIIEDWMAQYGEVISIREFKWHDKVFFKNKDNGVRVIRIRLQKSIPSYISVHGEETYVTYKNQIPTCRHCGYKAHRGRGCMENKMILGVRDSTVNDRMERARSSYAETVGKPGEQNKYHERMEDEPTTINQNLENGGKIVQAACSNTMTTDEENRTQQHSQPSEMCESKQNEQHAQQLSMCGQKSDNTLSTVDKLTLTHKNANNEMEMDSEVDSDDTGIRTNTTNLKNDPKPSTSMTNKSVKHKRPETDTTDEDRVIPRRSRKNK